MLWLVVKPTAERLYQNNNNNKKGLSNNPSPFHEKSVLALTYQLALHHYYISTSITSHYDAAKLAKESQGTEF